MGKFKHTKKSDNDHMLWEGNTEIVLKCIAIGILVCMFIFLIVIFSSI